MTIAVTAQTLYDGPRRAKMQFTGISDGSGELTLATLVDASTLSPLGPGQPCKSVKVERITGDVKPVGNVSLYWGALTPVKFAELTGARATFDYSNITAITVPPGTISATGDILISTAGMTSGTTYMIEIEMIKKSK
jgi:hypothetical protein